MRLVLPGAHVSEELVFVRFVNPVARAEVRLASQRVARSTTAVPLAGREELLALHVPQAAIPSDHGRRRPGILGAVIGAAAELAATRAQNSPGERPPAGRGMGMVRGIP